MAIKLSKEEFEKKFGKIGATTPKGYGSQVADAFRGGVEQVKKGFEQGKLGNNPLTAFQGATNIAAGAINALSSPIAPAFSNTIGKGVDYVADKVSNSPSVQKFAMSKAGQATSDVAETAGNLSVIAGTVEGVTSFKPGVKKIASTAKNVAETGADIVDYTKNVAKDVTPTYDRAINHQVTKALDLTQGDVKNIAQSTGNEVGRWVADKNLIGKNKAETAGNIKNFFEKSYKTVRDEISKVKDTYKQYNVPRFVEALKQLKQKVSGVPGMQEIDVEVANLLGKKDLSLMDVQRVKELIDDHFKLYKATGDVAQGVEKEGLANIRAELKQFIEQEVKNKTGADIGGLNNDVATAKGIHDAIELRSTSGLTRSNLKIGDLGIFGVGMGMGGPLVGGALLFGKKLLESPSIQLRIAKFLDGLSDASKARIAAKLEAGQIPAEFNQFIKGKH